MSARPHQAAPHQATPHQATPHQAVARPAPAAATALPSRRVPDLDSLALLLAVDAAGGIAAAARQLGLSQPAATARLHALERRAGAVLVERRSSGSTLTETGRLVAAWAAPLLDAAGFLAAGLATLTETASPLRVAASLTVAEHLLPAWLTQFAALHPDTTVTLGAMNSSRVEQAVLDGSVDLGFVEGPGAPRRLSSRVVAVDSLVVVVAPGHPWARRTTDVTAAELAAARLVQREPASGTRATLEAALRAAGSAMPAPPVLELSSSAAVRSAAVAGAGPAVLSHLAIHDDLVAGRLAAVPVGVALRRRLRAVWPQGTRPSPTARDLLAVVAAVSRGRARSPGSSSG
jgi:molybdate transport repressor ModE-like protein